MSEQRRQTCVLCQAETSVDSWYDGFKCSACGQDFCYEEGTVIALSDEQLNILRRAKGLPELPASR